MSKFEMMLSFTKWFIVLLMTFTVVTCKLLGQIEYLPANLYSKNIDTNILKTENYLNDKKSRKSPHETINMIGFLTSNYLIKSKYETAEKLILGCLNNQLVLKNEPSKAVFLYWLGNIKRYQNKMPEALQCYFESVRIFSDTKDWGSIMACKIELIEFYRKTGKYDKAMEFLKEAFFLLTDQKIQSTDLEMRLYNRAAAVENERSFNKESIFYSLKSIELAKKTNNLYYEASSYNEIGYSYKNLQYPDSALFYYKKAERIFTDIGAYDYAIHTMCNRGMLYNHYNYPKKIVFETYHKIENLVKKYNIEYPMQDIYSVLYDEYTAQGDSLKAMRYFYKYHVATIEAINKRSEEKLIEMTEKYDNEKIKSDFDKMNQTLDKTAQDLKQRKRENIIIYSFLVALLLLLFIVVFLFIKLNQTNNKLHQRNQEKDTFIQEIHHRVKNNLQFVSSLINMQVTASSDSTEIFSLNEASRRIRAMALVHEMLYKQEGSVGVSIKQYIEELVYSLKDLMNSESTNIEFKTNIFNRELSITSSIALGMITSELISNSMKYAFKNIENPTIEILLENTHEKNQYHFMVRDNGNGYVKNDLSPQTLGKRLIDIFSRQLKGTYQLYNDNGYVYQLYFTLN